MRRILATVALTLFVAGCGGSSASNSGGATTTPAVKATTTEDSTIDVTTTTPPITPAVPAYRILSEDQLTGALLDLQALPAGYTQEPPETSSADKTFCDYEPPVVQQAKVRRDFVKGGGISAELLSTGLRQYASPEEARAAFDALTDAIASCTGESYQGTQLTYAPMSAPRVGDGSVGVKISAGSTDLLQFFALVGPTLVNTGGGGPMNANANEVASLLEAQVNAYMAAAKG